MQLSKGDLGECYAFLDPSGGRNQTIKRIAARSAIVVVQECLEDSLLVREAWAAKCSTDELTEKIFEFNRQYFPRLFGVESNAMQSLYVDSVIREARERSFRLNLIPWSQPTNIQKPFRIRTTLQPWFSHGKIIIRDTLVELKNELLAFPTGTLVDLADALASVVAIIPPKNSLNTFDSEVLSLAKYMRNCGYGPDAIMRRITEIQATRQMGGFNPARYLRERGQMNG